MKKRVRDGQTEAVEPETCTLYVHYSETEETHETTDYINHCINVDFKYLSRTQPIGFSYSNSPEPVVVPVELAKKDRLYLVVHRYSDGGTFGSTSGCWQVLTITDDGDRATWVANNRSEWSKTDEGRHVFVYGSGYFGRHEGDEVHMLEVKDR